VQQLLHKRFGPGGGESTHVKEVAAGKALHIREFPPKITGQPAHDTAPPLFGLLAFHNGFPNGPVQLDELSIHGAQCLYAGGPYAVFEFAEGSV
jgi:hypothetical protein